jgi:RsmE family RNA methyltransferase
MNIILLRDQDFIDNSEFAIIQDNRLIHIQKVLDPTIGQALKVGLLNGNCGHGIVISINEQAVTLRVVLNHSPQKRHTFDIALALPRPKMLRRILRTIAEYGVENLYLINSARVEKSYWQSPLLHPDKIQNALIAGMERSKDTVMTAVHLHQRFRPFVEDLLPDLCESRRCWITDMAASQSAAEIDIASKPAVVLIGPEGGFVPFEVQLATSTIAQPINLGTRVLSVDTAVTTVLAQSLAR